MHELAPTPGPIACVVGARPNYMKVAPLIRALRADAAAPRTMLVHTGQHYDVAMNDRLFADLKLRTPDVNLDVGSGTHAQQTAEIMRRFEPVVDASPPSCVVVVGDVNSTLACSLVAVKKGIPVVHIEAGLRSFDRTMPEEINRLLTDQICDVLYTTERSAAENLRREGISLERVHFVGALLGEERGFGLVTLHRPSNVDEQGSLAQALAILGETSQELPLVCPLHPRTRERIERFGLWRMVDARRMVILPPQGYLETLGLMKDATLVITESGGIQEETTALGVPCLTMRENTERPITVEQGTNVVVGRDRMLIRRCVAEILAGGGKRGRVPELWDGRASERIAAHLVPWLARRAEPVYA
ncbi:MAG: UDP-N-acetyl glucosamine 2-epimerase [Betaproteobacteria bacterium]|nr:MAG: UDP-N-acetyl glucosamine 2-epimerase [Betaproteobacteria bacterium]